MLTEDIGGQMQDWMLVNYAPDLPLLMEVNQEGRMQRAHAKLYCIHHKSEKVEPHYLISNAKGDWLLSHEMFLERYL